MKVLTGGSGFIGSHLVERLTEGDAVTSIDNYSNWEFREYFRDFR